jgi:hypothetical protein
MPLCSGLQDEREGKWGAFIAPLRCVAAGTGRTPTAHSASTPPPCHLEPPAAYLCCVDAGTSQTWSLAAPAAKP